MAWEVSENAPDISACEATTVANVASMTSGATSAVGARL